MIKFRCTHCAKKIGMPMNAAGRRVRCTVCQTVQHVPMETPPDVDQRPPVARSTDAANSGAASARPANGSSMWEPAEPASLDDTGADTCPNCRATMMPGTAHCDECGHKSMSG